MTDPRLQQGNWSKVDGRWRLKHRDLLGSSSPRSSSSRLARPGPPSMALAVRPFRGSSPTPPPPIDRRSSPFSRSYRKVDRTTLVDAGSEGRWRVDPRVDLLQFPDVYDSDPLGSRWHVSGETDQGYGSAFYPYEPQF